jgi:CheY-like chemotaxis protein
MTTILVIEDNEANRDMLGRRLRRYGYNVIFAPDGPSGVQMARETVPDLILMDIGLGEMNGLEATKLIKANTRTRYIPIIALTAYAHSSDRERCLEAGCSDFESKPVELVRLLAKIEANLNRARAAARD